MTYIAPGYYTNRIFGLLLTLFFLHISGIQIFLLRQNNKKLTEVKYFIHYSVFLCAATLLFSFIDTYGIFELFSPLFSIMMVDVMGTRILQSSIIFIIYGHFNAHYRVLKKEIPKFFIIYLTLLYVITSIILIFTAPLQYITQNLVYQKIGAVSSLIWLGGIWSFDMYGYYLVRKFILDLKHSPMVMTPPPSASSPTVEVEITEMEPSSPSPRSKQTKPSKKSNKSGSRMLNHFDYEEFLTRMQRFHGLITLASFLFFGLVCYNITSSQALRKNLNPNKFSFFDGLIFYPYLYLLLCCLLTWWVWIPIKLKDCTLKLDSIHGHSQNTTQIHSQGSGQSKHHNHNEEEMMVLNSPTPATLQYSPHNNSDQQENAQKFHFPPTLRDVAGSISQEELVQRENNNLNDNSNHNKNNNLEHSVSAYNNEIESPKKEDRNIMMAGITEGGGIVAYGSET